MSPDPQPGRYYVTAIDGPKRYFSPGHGRRTPRRWSKSKLCDASLSTPTRAPSGWPMALRGNLLTEKPSNQP